MNTVGTSNSTICEFKRGQIPNIYFSIFPSNLLDKSKNKKMQQKIKKLHLASKRISPFAKKQIKKVKKLAKTQIKNVKKSKN